MIGLRSDGWCGVTGSKIFEFTDNQNNWEVISNHQAVLNLYKNGKCITKVWVIKSSDGIILEEIRSFPFRKEDRENFTLTKFQWIEELGKSKPRSSFVCRRCGDLFESIRDSVGLTCDEAPRALKRIPPKRRSKSEVDSMLGPRAGTAGSKWQLPQYSGVGLANLERLDPRSRVSLLFDDAWGSGQKKANAYLAEKLESYYLIKGKTYYEYPMGKSHDLIKN